MGKLAGLQYDSVNLFFKVCLPVLCILTPRCDHTHDRRRNFATRMRIGGIDCTLTTNSIEINILRYIYYGFSRARFHAFNASTSAVSSRTCTMKGCTIFARASGNLRFSAKKVVTHQAFLVSGCARSCPCAAYTMDGHVPRVRWTIRCSPLDASPSIYVRQQQE